MACRTSTAILRVQCGAPDPNRDHASSVWRAGPQLRSKGLVVVAERMSQRSSCKMSQDKSERMSEDMSERSSERTSEKGCQKEWSKICQECQKICLKEVQRECLGKDVRNNVQKYVSKNVSQKWGELEVVEDITSMMFESQLSPLQV